MTENVSNLIVNGFYGAYKKRLLEIVKSDPIPRHIAIIMDGNRRYAEERGDPALKGHEYGGEKLREMLDWCFEVDVKILTVYAFSTENFTRNSEEVDCLMDLFVDNLRRSAEDDMLKKNGVRFKVLGNIDILSEKVREAIRFAEERTKDNDRFLFNMAVAYGGREEIVNAVKNIVRDHESGKISVDDIDEKMFSSYLYTQDLPDPDLILRTSGEIRLSNFLLYQLAYSEFYFTDVYWPGFRKVDFLRAIRNYQMRLRRFGR